MMARFTPASFVNELPCDRLASESKTKPIDAEYTRIWYVRQAVGYVRAFALAVPAPARSRLPGGVPVPCRSDHRAGRRSRNPAGSRIPRPGPRTVWVAGLPSPADPRLGVAGRCVPF